MLGIPLYLAVLQVAGGPGAILMLTLLLVVLACWVADRAERALGEHDSGEIVIDEVVGMLIALLWIPPTFPNLAIGFLLFRVFDIVKVWPASTIDRRLPGGVGVVLDDVVSGIYANLLMQLVA